MSSISPDSLKMLIDSVGHSSMRKYLKSFYFDCKVKNLTPKTMDGCGERLENFHRFIQSKDIPFEKVDRHLIQSYILSMKDRVSDYTINGRIRILRFFFNYLQREGLLNNGNPMNGIKLIRAEKKFPRIITMDEMERLLTVPNKRTFVGYRNYIMLLLFWDAMICLSEMLSLKLSDIDYHRSECKKY
jgi:site-specific recombinase XerD